MSSGLRSPLPPPDFGISDPWEVTESEKEEEEKAEDQEFTYQNPEFETPNSQTQQNLNPENLEIKTLNIQTLPIQDNRNPDLINQQNLLPQLLQLPPQQSVQQQPLQQPPQQSNLDPMAYAPITKLDNFTTIQAIPYFFKDTTNLWYQSLINKPQDFNVFKVEFLRYFSNNNCINWLANTFSTIKQEETEAVTTYMGRFHQNLRQIQAIDTNYFTAPQILNQFIHGLCSSILQHVCPLHPDIFQDTVTHARDFKSAKSEANHAQVVNLVINRSSDLDSKLKQFSNTINQKIEGYLKRVFATTVVNKITLEPTISDSESLLKSRPISNHLPANDAAINLSTASILISNLSTAATGNLSATAPNNLSAPTTNSNTTPKPHSNNIRKPKT
ncbi:hypothetical protein G9A89_003596 [Geosiphon pyriformis]|nr:hypothetical protein G9A89_003596 [Geosiphon pyriformis]